MMTSCDCDIFIAQFLLASADPREPILSEFGILCTFQSHNWMLTNKSILNLPGKKV